MRECGCVKVWLSVCVGLFVCLLKAYSPANRLCEWVVVWVSAGKSGCGCEWGWGENVGMRVGVRVRMCWRV